MASFRSFSSAAALILSLVFLGAAKPRVALFLGDSLTSGFGVDDKEAFPALIGKRWKKDGSPWTAKVFAAIGAETSDLRDSLDFALADGGVDFAVVMIGGNDGFAHVPADKVRKNVSAILDLLAKKKIPAALVAMWADPKDDPAYAHDFDRIFPDVAAKFGVPLLAFPMNGIVKNPKLTVDKFHPNQEGHRLIAERLYAELKKAGLPK